MISVLTGPCDEDSSVSLLLLLSAEYSWLTWSLVSVKFYELFLFSLTPVLFSCSYLKSDFNRFDVQLSCSDSSVSQILWKQSRRLGPEFLNDVIVDRKSSMANSSSFPVATNSLSNLSAGASPSMSSLMASCSRLTRLWAYIDKESKAEPWDSEKLEVDGLSKQESFESALVDWVSCLDSGVKTWSIFDSLQRVTEVPPIKRIIGTSLSL